MKAIIFTIAILFSSLVSSPMLNAATRVETIGATTHLGQGIFGWPKKKYNTVRNRNQRSCLNKKGCSRPKTTVFNRHKGCPATNY
jgi:hypothetical protein